MNANRLAQKPTPSARLKAHLIQPTHWQVDNYAIDIRRDRHGEFLKLRGPLSMRDTLDLTVLQANTRDRPLWVLVANLPRVAEAD
jgi:hypothetical protein